MSQTDLSIGDPAPELRVSAFVKGGPVTNFTGGTVYVVECWATWCGPCIASIPHLTLLQATHPEVTVLGVAVRETDPEVVRAFVAERGDEMGYRVAIDTPLMDGGSGGWMFERWCEAAYQPGIPAAFIVDRAGRIAWAGHPLELDGPLAAVVDGTWDIEAKAQAHRDRISSEKVRETRAMSKAVDQHRNADDIPGAIRVYDEAFALHPEFEQEHGLSKFELLIRAQREAGTGYGRRLMDTVFAENSNMCLFLGMSIIRFLYAETREAGASPDGELTTLALVALRKAESLEDDGTLYYRPLMLPANMAEALLASGDAREAHRYATSAREWASKTEPDEAHLDLDDLIRRCEGAGGASPETRKTPPAVVCDGDVCRLV